MRSTLLGRFVTKACRRTTAYHKVPFCQRQKHSPKLLYSHLVKGEGAYIVVETLAPYFSPWSRPARQATEGRQPSNVKIVSHSRMEAFAAAKET
jgi:hypothetical protein